MATSGNTQEQSGAGAEPVPTHAEMSKYKVIRNSTGTGIFSSIFTLCLLVFSNELYFVLYNYDYLFRDLFGSFLFSAGFIISVLNLVFAYCVLFVPKYMLVDNNKSRLAPLILSIILQFIMIHFNTSYDSFSGFLIQNLFDKFVILRKIFITYGSLAVSLVVAAAMCSNYNSTLNKLFRPFEYDTKTLEEESPV